MDAASLVAELEPTVEASLERALSGAEEWVPPALVRWSRARDFVADEAWDPREVDLDPAVRSALLVNLLTEDNLPYYTSTITSLYGDDGVWGVWVRRWTAEEGRHSIVLRDYHNRTRAPPPIAVSRGRTGPRACG